MTMPISIHLPHFRGYCWLMSDLHSIFASARQLYQPLKSAALRFAIAASRGIDPIFDMLIVFARGDIVFFFRHCFARHFRFFSLSAAFSFSFFISQRVCLFADFSHHAPARCRCFDIFASLMFCRYLFHLMRVRSVTTKRCSTPHRAAFSCTDRPPYRLHVMASLHAHATPASLQSSSADAAQRLSL
jgi:hypothetical protein